MSKRQRQTVHGGSLGLVLAVAALALLAAFTAATVATLNLRMASKVSNTAVADALAESVVQEAIAHLQEDLGFNKDIEIRGEPGLPGESRGVLTFKSKSGVPYSTNNFLGDSADGWQRKLPDKTVHLVGRGESGGVTRHVEAIVYVPEYPVSAACSGPVTVRNSLLAGFEPEEDRKWVPGQGYSTKEDELGPGHLITNSDSPNSVILDRKTKITGDVQSRGGVSLNGALVEGEVRAPWGRNAPLPDFKLEEFDPKNSEDIYFEELDQLPSTATLVGNVRHDGSAVMNGNLILDNAFLFVNGDLEVKGEVKGIGALVITGKILFHGSVDVTATSQIALLSGQGITLEGKSSTRNIFHGLLYTQGPFQGTKVTIVGSFIVDNGQTAVLEDSNVFYSQELVAPKIRRETAAVIPRFYVPTAEERATDLRLDDQTQLPIGSWEKGKQGYFMPGRPRVARTIANVLDINHPNWSRSDWNQYDPAVVRVRWVDGQAVFAYELWGHQDNSGYLDDSVNNLMTPLSFDDLVRVVSDTNTSGNTQEHLNGRVPSKDQYREYLKEVLNHIQETGSDTQNFNFTVDPNEFINEVDRLRILLYRRF